MNFLKAFPEEKSGKCLCSHSGLVMPALRTGLFWKCFAVITYFTVGPTADNLYLVVYMTPGCKVLTVASEGHGEANAIAETKRLNLQQINREKAIRADRMARGLDGTYPALVD